MKNRQGIQGAKRLLSCQCVVTVLFASIALLCTGSIQVLMSALLGGFISIVPNACFAVLFFKSQEASAAKQIVKRFYRGEALKIVLTMLLFAVVFQCFLVSPGVFFAAFILAQMVFWITPWL